MQRFEYRVVAAPKQAERSARSMSRTQNFTSKLEAVLNELGRDGWEYLRTDSLEVEMPEMRRGKVLEIKYVLVFRRVLAEDAAAFAAPRGLDPMDFNGHGAISDSDGHATVLDDPRYC